MKQIKRLLRYSYKFITNQKYRNHVLDVIERQTKREKYENNEIDFDLKSLQWLANKSFFMIGGCELTYMKERIEFLGAECYHTFDTGSATDPKLEIMNPKTELWNRKFDYIVLSQVQIFRNLLQKIQFDGPSYQLEEQEKPSTCCFWLYIFEIPDMSVPKLII